MNGTRIGSVFLMLLGLAGMPGGALAAPQDGGGGKNQHDPPGNSPPVDEETAKKAIKDYEDAVKLATTEDANISAIHKLGAVNHVLIVKALASLLQPGQAADVNLAVVKALDKQSDPSAVLVLIEALPAHEEKGDEKVLIAILGALGDHKDHRAGAAVASLVKNHLIPVAKAAMEAAGKIRAVEAIDPILHVLKEASLPAGGGRNRTPNPKAPLKKPCLDALRQITLQNFTTDREWEDWWRANHLTFTVN
jgi:hypothetical protein